VEKTFSTLQEILNQSVVKYASRNCLSFVDSTPITYQDFGTQVNNLSKTLVANGFGKGDKIALLSHNMPNWGVAYFAIQSDFCLRSIEAKTRRLPH
jgi:long-chain acyl-CoA synthetase